jgi:uncharacterized repeat protein (TIGR03803 family)
MNEPTSESRWVVISSYAFRSWALGVLMALGLVAEVPVTAANPVLQTLYGFGVNPKNPQAGLVQASDGNFYGTTAFGGSVGENGTIFRVSSNGEFTSLFSFDGTNGSRPLASLIQGTDGNLYGTTAFGGTSGDHGTIFRITLGGILTRLFSFRGTDGSRPQAGLIQASDGSFYGTTAAGGANTDSGTLFRITPGGAFTLLYSFPAGGGNGASPLGTLIQHTDGNFLGTTALGGSSGLGTVFRVTPSGGFTLLSSFTGPNGSGPAAGLVRGPDGNYYGTTQVGGITDNGTIFKMTPSGVLSSLFSFSGPNGNYPVSPLALGSDGNFYGTTSGDRAFGGVNTYGTAFQITLGGALTTLAVFNFNNGATPAAGLARGSDGNFYGTTFEGGEGSGGTIFRLVEPPFVFLTTPASGRAVVNWISFTNGLYRVQYKSAFGVPTWLDLSPDIRATGARTTFTDNLGSATVRFYRVALLLP